jgi:hypothetical protein
MTTTLADVKKLIQGRDGSKVCTDEVIMKQINAYPNKISSEIADDLATVCQLSWGGGRESPENPERNHAAAPQRNPAENPENTKYYLLADLAQ